MTPTVLSRSSKSRSQRAKLLKWYVFWVAENVLLWFFVAQLLGRILQPPKVSKVILWYVLFF